MLTLAAANFVIVDLTALCSCTSVNFDRVY